MGTTCEACGVVHVPYYKCSACGCKFDDAADPAIDIITCLIEEFDLPKRPEDCATAPQAHVIQEAGREYGPGVFTQEATT